MTKSQEDVCKCTPYYEGYKIVFWTFHFSGEKERRVVGTLELGGEGKGRDYTIPLKLSSIMKM